MADVVTMPSFDRRHLMRMLGGALLAGTAAGVAGTGRAREVGRIGRLIAEVQALASISARLDGISRAYLGSRYAANTLIGGPARREQFVVRDDAFDCVTFCEIVLAAALAHDYASFEARLKGIRYANGVVRWDERNHYFADWYRRAIENEIGRPIELPHAATIDKSVHWGNLGRRQMAMQGVPAASLLAQPSELISGDIVGFLSRRATLDVFHTGLVIVPPTGDLLLRHASQSRRLVVDEPLARFVAVNRVQFALLLRPLDRLKENRGA